MAKAFTGLQGFLNRVRSEHLPRSDRFEVIFSVPPGVTTTYDNFERMTYFTEEVQLPGLSATNLPVRLGNWTEYRNSNLEFLGADTVIGFIADKNWKTRGLFERWIALTANPRSKEVAWFDTIRGSMQINCLDNQDTIIKTYYLEEVIPKLINLTPMSSSNATVARFTVSFSCTYWWTETINVSPFMAGGPPQEEIPTREKDGASGVNINGTFGDFSTVA